jgi:TolB protein
MGLVLGQDRPEVPLTEDEHPVGELCPGGEHEPFRVSVRARAALRLSLAGRLVKVLASGAKDATAVYSSSGAAVAVAGASGLQLVSNNGGVIRRLPVPRTGSSGCTPIRWWDARAILAACVATGTHRDRLWLVPASGARPRPLTPQHGPHSPDPGDLDAWATPGALYLQGITPGGRALIFRQQANGALRAIKVPGSANDNWIASARSSRLLVSETSRCGQSTSLLWFSPATGREQTLLKAPRDRVGVLALAPYGPPLADVSVEVVCTGGSATRDLRSPGEKGFAPGLLRR